MSRDGRLPENEFEPSSNLARKRPLRFKTFLHIYIGSASPVGCFKVKSVTADRIHFFRTRLSIYTDHRPCIYLPGRAEGDRCFSLPDVANQHRDAGELASPGSDLVLGGYPQLFRPLRGVPLKV